MAVQLPHLFPLLRLLDVGLHPDSSNLSDISPVNRLKFLSASLSTISLKLGSLAKMPDKLDVEGLESSVFRIKKIVQRVLEDDILAGSSAYLDQEKARDTKSLARLFIDLSKELSSAAQSLKPFYLPNPARSPNPCDHNALLEVALELNSIVIRNNEKILSAYEQELLF